MELHEIAIKNSSWVWRKLREARTNDFQVGEESLTDFVILNIKMWGAGKIVVDTFTRNAESLNGADWEWWFTGPSGQWLGMRVQAKVLKLASEEYEHLHYKNKNGYQADLLISDAKKYNLIPLYCMYNNWEPNKYKANWKCKTHKASVLHYGMSILRPEIVQKLRAGNRRSLASAIEYLRPMHCMFCCKGYGGDDLPMRALSWMVAAGVIKAISGKEEGKGDREEGEESQYIRDEPPNYVKLLVEGRMEGQLEEVFSDARLARVTVFKELSLK